MNFPFNPFSYFSVFSIKSLLGTCPLLERLSGVGICMGSAGSVMTDPYEKHVFCRGCGLPSPKNADQACPIGIKLTQNLAPYQRTDARIRRQNRLLLHRLDSPFPPLAWRLKVARERGWGIEG